MEESTVKRLGLILSIQAEIEGMKAENMQRDYPSERVAYSEEDFQEKAEELRNMVYCPEEKL